MGNTRKTTASVRITKVDIRGCERLSVDAFFLTKVIVSS
jgi:hypothetical protein